MSEKDPVFSSARWFLSNSYTMELVCGACDHVGPIDLTKLVEEGRGDVAMGDLNWRCSACGKRDILYRTKGGPERLKPPTYITWPPD